VHLRDDLAGMPPAQYGDFIMGLSFPHLMLVILVVVLLFGGGRISGLMGDVAKGIKSFKKGMADDDDTKPAARIDTATVIEAEKQPDKSV
jgi:sec-independent protein translocase protein TatA